ncbi:hypothetical protein BJ138DRAFT_1021270 [Hygrophoropsis aurantiaca]|uniref:Uncharacterized protein n=1 Tax=Hygrophoropsis aurantiaca TaxID=72124 RepID=A0ACB7ZRN3_9AGAM|nr:hypothetical protein BJ138DRAFT_1021270 [Hygrophoropsis aurantiaca]
MLCRKKGPKLSIVSDLTTCRRHIESKHPAPYRDWCSKVDFKSKLPGDVKKRKAAIAIANASQTRIDGHLRPATPTERVVPYTDARFRQVAAEWLIENDMPIQALDHPKFKEMIDVASRATNGVKIPNRKATRDEIMNMFKKQMTRLKDKLNVGLSFVSSNLDDLNIL